MATGILNSGSVQALPLVHGRLPFAMEARRLLLGRRWGAVAVELPASLRAAVIEGLEELPRISAVLYRERPSFVEGGERRLWYVAVDPCDGIIEALRIARGERTPIHFVDAEVEEFEPRPHSLPDAHALHGLGLDRWYELVSPFMGRLARTGQDAQRESHMAARLQTIRAALGPDKPILFLCGLAHWGIIRRHLEEGTGELHEGSGPDPSLVKVVTVHPRSLMHLLGEMPHLAWRWEEHRDGWDPGAFEPEQALKQLLLDARKDYDATHPDSLEKVSQDNLRSLLRYLRKLVVGQQRLMPDAWSLAVAARGCVGNDFAVRLLEVANAYPPNESAGDDGIQMTESAARVEDEPEPAAARTPGEARTLRHLSLRRRPERRKAAAWRRGWNPHDHCSWPPEDLVIEQFRAYVTRRALTLAGLSLRRTEPFTTSFKDGIAIRESLRDWHLGRIHVKEEPPVSGDVGALVTIFEEDDEGLKFPWRTTWMAEHEEESTLAFYATEPTEDMVGPAIGRMFYGGCMFIYPPLMIPDVWSDLRFEQARRPSERLLLAALYYAREKFVAHLGPTPPAPEVRRQAATLGKHIVHLPLAQFSERTLERMRRAHVLNGRHVRSWAARFI